jgi:hypothetical protein
MNDTPRNPILPDILELTERSVEQARQAFDDWMATTKRAVSAVEGQAAAAHSSARELQRKVMGFAEYNVARPRKSPGCTPILSRSRCGCWPTKLGNWAGLAPARTRLPEARPARTAVSIGR